MSKTKKNLEIDTNGKLSQVNPAPSPEISIWESPKDEMAKTEVDLKKWNNARARPLAKMLAPLIKFLNGLYKNPRHGCVGINKVFDANTRLAIKGEYPKFSIEFSRVQLSVGKLPIAQGISVSSPIPGKLIFCWTDNSGMDKALATDKVFVAIYCSDLRLWTSCRSAAQRKDGYCVSPVSAFRGKRVQAYLGFVSSDLARTSNSYYAGQVTVF